MPKTTKLEMEIVQALTSKRGEISLVIPDKMDPKLIHESLKALLKGIDDVEGRVSKCRPLIGRLMILAKDNPATYEDLGYENYEDYKTKELAPLTGYSRSTLGDCKQLIEKWPNLTMDQYAACRTSKLLLIGRWTNQNEAGHKKYLEWCETKTYDEIKQLAIDKGLLGEGESEGGSLIVTGSKAMIKRIKSFLVDDRAIAYFETNNPAAMIEKAFQESSSEWPPEAEAKAS
jgi:hypothetical protein